MVFAAELNTGSTGIFTGPDPVVDKLIGTGDLLDGSTVTDLVLSNRALNNSNQVVFVATLTDANGTTHEAVYRAEPVPEPNNVVLFGMATFVMLGSGWLRRKQSYKKQLTRRIIAELEIDSTKVEANSISPRAESPSANCSLNSMPV